MEIQTSDMEEAKDSAEASADDSKEDMDEGTTESGPSGESAKDSSAGEKVIKPPTQDEFLWVWKVWLLALAMRCFLTSNTCSLNWRLRVELSFYDSMYTFNAIGPLATALVAQVMTVNGRLLLLTATVPFN